MSTVSPLARLTFIAIACRISFSVTSRIESRIVVARIHPGREPADDLNESNATKENS